MLLILPIICLFYILTVVRELCIFLSCSPVHYAYAYCTVFMNEKMITKVVAKKL